MFCASYVTGIICCFLFYCLHVQSFPTVFVTHGGGIICCFLVHLRLLQSHTIALCISYRWNHTLSSYAVHVHRIIGCCIVNLIEVESLSFAFHIGGLIQHFLVHLILLEYAIVLFTSYTWDDMLFSWLESVSWEGAATWARWWHVC